MEKTLNQYQMVEFEFSTTLTRYLKYFNLLEKNVGLCISFLVNKSDSKAAYPFLDRLNTQGMMDVLKELIFYKNTENNDEIIRDYSQWLKLASKTRVARNRYVHGYWDVTPHLKENPIRFYPTKWTSGVGKEVADSYSCQKMSLDDFKKVAQEVEIVFEKFNQFRKNMVFSLHLTNASRATRQSRAPEARR